MCPQPLPLSRCCLQVLGPHGDLQWHIAAEELTNMRTAAASAVASQEIVPPAHFASSSADAVVIAIIGTGPVAAAHLHAFALAYPAANFLIVSRLLQVPSPLSHLHARTHRPRTPSSADLHSSGRKTSAAATPTSAPACHPATTQHPPPPPPPSSSWQPPPPRPCSPVLTCGAVSCSSASVHSPLPTASALSRSRCAAPF
jgi:hypothetical protein